MNAKTIIQKSVKPSSAEKRNTSAILIWLDSKEKSTSIAERLVAYAHDIELYLKDIFC